MTAIANVAISLPQQGTWVLDSAHTTAGFVGRYLMISKVAGTFTDVAGRFHIAENPEDSNLEVTIQAASLTTAHTDRDTHLKSPDFLDADTFPTIEFVSTKVEGAGTKWTVTGDLTIKEVTRPVTLDVEYHGVTADPWGNTRAAFSATTRIDRNDWGLSWNVALETGGVLIGPKVTIEIEAQGVLESD